MKRASTAARSSRKASAAPVLEQKAERLLAQPGSMPALRLRLPSGSRSSETGAFPSAPGR